MTASDLFKAYPRPFRLSETNLATALDASGQEVFSVTSRGDRSYEDAISLTELLIDLANRAEG